MLMKRCQGRAKRLDASVQHERLSRDSDRDGKVHRRTFFALWQSLTGATPWLYDSLLKGDRLGKSCGFAVASWCHQKIPLKLLREVRLIKKAGFIGNIAHFEPLR